MIKTPFLCFFVALVILATACKHTPETVPDPPPPPPPPPPPDTVYCHPDTAYFMNDVFPLLTSSCAKSGCHDALTQAGGVNLTDYTQIIQTGQIVAGNPDDSELYEKITETDPDKIMPPPPNTPLTAGQIALIRKWILQGAKNNQCVEKGCDSINVTLSGTLNPILQMHCTGCHGAVNPGAGFNLTTYEGLVASANTGQLMGAIRHDPGYRPMPLNGNKLSECHIAQFRKWIIDGKPNN